MTSGHGTHTMGTMVGDDGVGNQIGMAPGAKWIGCRNMKSDYGTPATYAECYQWFIAPTAVDGKDPDPGMAPDVINNSWSCLTTEGCTDPNVLLTVVQSVRAAGIVTVHSAGNAGSSCSTVTNPAAIYAESFSVGATDIGGVIASFSSRGPVKVDGSHRMKPDVSAPGVAVRSSTYSSDTSYGSKSGTSMAAPHVAGLVALVIDANEAFRGEVDAIENVIEHSALGKTTSQGCGGDSATAVPNNVYGWGRIDALAAYQQAIAYHVAITRPSSTVVTLSWGAVKGADHYHVWWGASPYFTPGASCPEEPDRCTSIDGTSIELDVPVDTSINMTWLMQPVDESDGVLTAPPARVGEFDFELTPGSLLEPSRLLLTRIYSR